MNRIEKCKILDDFCVFLIENREEIPSLPIPIRQNWIDQKLKEYKEKIPSTEFHITDYSKEYEENTWELKFPIEKRINAMAGDEENKFIDFVFSRYGIAIMLFRKTALSHLEDIMKYQVRKIRNALAEKGATPELLEKYDNKVHDCFEKTVKMVESRANNSRNPYKEEDMTLLKTLKSYSIYEYHNGDAL